MDNRNRQTIVTTIVNSIVTTVLISKKKHISMNSTDIQFAKYFNNRYVLFYKIIKKKQK